MYQCKHTIKTKKDKKIYIPLNWYPANKSLVHMNSLLPLSFWKHHFSLKNQTSQRLNLVALESEQNCLKQSCKQCQLHVTIFIRTPDESRHPSCWRFNCKVFPISSFMNNIITKNDNSINDHGCKLPCDTLKALSYFSLWEIRKDRLRWKTITNFCYYIVKFKS